MTNVLFFKKNQNNAIIFLSESRHIIFGKMIPGT